MDNQLTPKEHICFGTCPTCKYNGTFACHYCQLAQLSKDLEESDKRLPVTDEN